MEGDCEGDIPVSFTSGLSLLDAALFISLLRNGLFSSFPLGFGGGGVGDLELETTDVTELTRGAVAVVLILVLSVGAFRDNDDNNAALVPLFGGSGGGGPLAAGGFTVELNGGIAVAFPVCCGGGMLFMSELSTPCCPSSLSPLSVSN